MLISTSNHHLNIVEIEKMEERFLKIKILCDSLCDIPQEIAEKDYLEVVPLTIMLGGVEYKEGVDIKEEEFYKLLKSNPEIPKTSQATYMEFKSLFDKYLEQGYDIICMTGTAKSSGTYQSAMLAKNDLENGNVHVFDTQNLSLGSGQYVIRACELLEEGKDCTEIINELERIRDSVRLIFMPFTLDYLKMSGRVPIVAAFVGNMIGLKPILYFNDGDSKIVGSIRGTKQIVSKLVDAIIKLTEGKKLEDMVFTVGCGDNLDFVKKLEEELKKKIKCRKLYMTRGGVAICSHTGPDILAISCSY